MFVRFSTVGGSRGSADTPRDVRGFAVKFYTQEGNYDLVGNNMPVFFIQDADEVSRLRSRREARTAQRDTAGFVGPRHALGFRFAHARVKSHMMMWLMSDRALPRAFANMEGFGVHTFRFINAGG